MLLSKVGAYLTLKHFHSLLLQKIANGFQTTCITELLQLHFFHKRPIRDVYLIYLISFEARELPLDGGHHSISCWDNGYVMFYFCQVHVSFLQINLNKK